MERKRAVVTEHAPAAIGPYSQGIWSGDLFYSSGQIGLDPSTGQIVPGGIEAEALRVFENLGAVLEAAGLSFDDVIKTTVFLADMGEFGLVNGIYAGYFGVPYPARSTVAVDRLPMDARVEIEVVARRA